MATMMKTFFLASLLVAAVCLEKGHSLRCFHCADASSNWDCFKTQMCPATDKFCVTTIIAAGRGQSDERQINKGCSSNCTERKVDTGIASVSTKCCSSSLCNVDGP
ncbi:lymphocyte antigen 6E-like [Sceloporus undulatus]|uniref:lymphocyte antigen 6E-like n=1 Tax=Sceloporus undulatus TaxID=8520 RepID=UPI001C4AAA88|nr:lymphocyte antigen 6E-like [Sceloporus undulatus]